MGKKLKQQRRGKGSSAYTKLPGTFDISVNYPHLEGKMGEVVNIFNHTGHTAPLMEIVYEDFKTGYLIAPEGISIGDKVYFNKENSYSLGSIMPLSQIPEGVPIYNIEFKPGDGGKIVRAAGSYAFISGRKDGMVSLTLPSKIHIELSENCEAQIGVIAGGGRKDQPLMKAGKNHYIKHAINALWPVNRGVKMSPVDHPFGGKQHHKGKSSLTSRNAPPGRKVGNLAARRSGRKKK